jgi:hypothetical protein
VARPTLYYPVILRATSASARTFSQSATRQGGAAKLKLDPPTGWLWGKDPKDKKSKKWESWEPVWYFGYFGSMAVAAIAYMYKPDTRYVLLLFSGHWLGLRKM